MSTASHEQAAAPDAAGPGTLSHNPFGGTELKYRADIDGLRTIAVVPASWTQ